MSGNAKQNVAVLFGGRSVENEISVITALHLMASLDVTRFNVIPVYVAPDGVWYTGDSLLDRAIYKNLGSVRPQLREVTLLPKPGQRGLTVLNDAAPAKRAWSWGKQEPAIIPVDIFFPAFHGTYGEDGCMQGLLELADVTYTGCNVFSAALSMNKWATKRIAAACGIPVLPDARVLRDAARKDLQGTVAAVRATPGLEQFPLFIKPCNLGSSVGIAAAKDEDTLRAGLANVFQFDTMALVEPKVEKIRELNVSVISENGGRASVTESPLTKDEAGALTYEDKYRGSGKKKASQPQSQGMASLSRKVDPEDVTADTKAAAQRYSTTIYEALGCRGVVRIDYIIDDSSGSLYFNEINPLPGSLANYLWAESTPPVLYTELLSRIVDEAIANKQMMASLRRASPFETVL